MPHQDASISTTYSICGVTVGVVFQQPEQAALFEDLWGRFFVSVHLDSRDAAPQVHLLFQHADASPSSRGTGEEVFSSVALRVMRTQSGFRLERGASFLSLDLARSCGAGILDGSFWDTPWPYQREFFLLTLLMLLRRHGRYGLHANGLVREDASCLVVGASGSGKSTLTLALLQAGWRYLSDDAIMLRRTPNGIEALAFRRGFSFTAETIDRLIPQTGDEHLWPAVQDGKRLVDLQTVYPGQFVQSCLPSALLFPAITGELHTRLAPANATRSITALIQQSPGILVDRQAARVQLEVLKCLAEQAPGYDLLLGADVYDDPIAVSELLRSALGV